MANFAYLQIIRQCNQQCIICSNPDNGLVLSLPEIRTKIDDFKKRGFEGIILTGGEPTLHPELKEIMTYSSQSGLFVNMISNGQKIADYEYLEMLKKAGLRQLHLSIYSHKKEVQGKISKNKESLPNIKKALVNLQRLGNVKVNMNVVIGKWNADNLSELIKMLVTNYPFVDHFVFNNLDPTSERIRSHSEVIPRMNDFQLELFKALEIIQKNHKTARVERVPLCYMTGYEHLSTETRKIVKKEKRVTYFLDDKGEFLQESGHIDGFYKKKKDCVTCSLNNICIGLYNEGNYYKMDEAYPVFVDKKKIINKILKNV
ncbi:radical SAM protein [Candidatus Parcubacteria bacterium]|nr:radical SAM protein [Patescibacteria group bacterium]MBU4309573.1 radical SAM protein [Patescibacteria group bacterium]MBU4432258.1 radical SAM protein [Patescibacteria group bacterium]MBU4578039.1 radical SAM protein [Patescibacteria group bacterium]MCG2696453.1 radical SAM protein [Candidatus Parcubacteria bacterium]